MRIDDLITAVEREGRAAVAMIAVAHGSAPREAGAALLVTGAGVSGTIGGGSVEFQSAMHARQLLANAAADGDAEQEHVTLDFPLGPALDQCCGGHLQIAFAVFSATDLPRLRACEGSFELWPGGPLLQGDPDPAPVLVYGAGHVGAALVRALAPLPFAIRWVDARLGAFPADLPPGAVTVATPLPEAEARSAPSGAMHVILTHSHALDLEIAAAILERDDFGFLGLIGSATKKTLFLKRMRERGIPECRLARLVCPIGVSGIRDKRPAVIAASVAAQLLQESPVAVSKENRQSA